MIDRRTLLRRGLASAVLAGVPASIAVAAVPDRGQRSPGYREWIEAPDYSRVEAVREGRVIYWRENPEAQDRHSPHYLGRERTLRIHQVGGSLQDAVKDADEYFDAKCRACFCWQDGDQSGRLPLMVRS